MRVSLETPHAEEKSRVRAARSGQTAIGGLREPVNQFGRRMLRRQIEPVRGAETPASAFSFVKRTEHGLFKAVQQVVRSVGKAGNGRRKSSVREGLLRKGIETETGNSASNHRDCRRAESGGALVRHFRRTGSPVRVASSMPPSTHKGRHAARKHRVLAKPYTLPRLTIGNAISSSGLNGPGRHSRVTTP